ncbi:O-methyltransferase family 3 protein [Coniophora puteana RWD-64-598 SS2]|uniref:O-methyltransferase family 3 protein n=1 Tax=Coniophora puteana (strain RWD-64-598) TaxID=741705 RepID=A0A5M3N2P5_CONPW|nr:O-methyltransferase family 3 protein [Coniophora puteana RWD-64-598 SS2]EIW85662.1 O-methyltransferase family 3 protein [Coniophora puteana RWD-64-598 SS2]
MDPSEPQWAKSVSFHDSYLLKMDMTIEAALENSDNNGLPQIAVPNNEGKFLKLLARTFGAKRILEVGTLGGVSTIWMAQGMPQDGRITTLEVSEKNAEVAKQNFENAGLSSQIELIVGDAHDTLAKLQPSEPFDMIFIDADKKSYPAYWTEARRMVRKGGVIIVDNVIRYGRVADLEYEDPDVLGVRKLVAMVKEDDEFDATAIPTVGEKGFDGFMYAIRL